MSQIPKNTKERIIKKCLDLFPVENTAIRSKAEPIIDTNEPERNILYDALVSEASRALPLLEALEKIQKMKRGPGEDNDNYVFNRCWHIAEEAIKNFKQ